MRKLIAVSMLLVLACPVFAQFYSYRDADGKLHITDKPIKKKGYKLVKEYLPPSMREARKAQKKERRLSQRARQPSSAKFVLSEAQIAGLVEPIARSMKVDPELVKAVIQIESGRNARIKSNKGAMGLMQLIPETADRFGVKNPWDPRQNVRGGIAYLRYLLGYFEGNVDHVLAAYNAGENAVDKYGGIPPYKETRNYLKKIRKIYDIRQLPFDEKIKNRSKLVQRKPNKSVAQVASAD